VAAAKHEHDKHAAHPRRRGLLGRLRGYLIAGVLVTAPIGITFYFAYLLISFVDNRITPLIPAVYNPNTYLPFAIPGLGVIVLLLTLTLVGALTAGLIGRSIVRLGDKLLHQTPFIRSIYGATKQIVETVLSQQTEAFRQVVLFEYPRRGCWAMGFVTGRTSGEVQNVTTDEVVNVFLPTTPNPTSGYLLFVPRRELVVLDMSVEEGIKMVVSGGIVTPPDTRTAEARELKLIAGAEGDKPTVYRPHDIAPTPKDRPRAVGDDGDSAAKGIRRRRGLGGEGRGTPSCFDFAQHEGLR